ncbi:MAG: guanylate kinase [Alphaproteobacteria bacterium]|nr:guanylate kinase [Alphaproteobacteria bacterium]
MSSPSGAGKTTLSRKLLAADSNIAMSVSVTTRKPRPGEVDGKDYHFIDQATFEKMVAAGELLEWATVFGNSYGTPKKPVEEALAKGRDVLFDIDWQGTQQLAQAMEDDLVRVFILPPNAETLRDRLIGRAQDSSSVVAKRMAEAPREISHWPEYDYVVVNDDADAAHLKVTAILTAERLRRRRQVGLTDFVRVMMKDL